MIGSSTKHTTRRHVVRFNNHKPLMALAMLIAALALAVGISACGGGDSSTMAESTEAEPAETETGAEEEGEAGEEETGGEGEAITSNPENAKVSLTIGSKNFPEQEILGEI
jgi:hypothetical protein